MHHTIITSRRDTHHLVTLHTYASRCVIMCVHVLDAPTAHIARLMC
jgi:hypothetical protein